MKSNVLFELLPETYENEKPSNITAINKFHLKSDCIIGSIVNGVRQCILYSFALDKPPGQKIYKEPRINPFKKIKRYVLSHITFYLEDDEYKSVNFI